VCGRRALHRAAGFNLTEVSFVLSVVLTAGVLTTPPLTGFLLRTKTEAAMVEASALLRASRSIAITRGKPAVVVIEPETRSLVAFADVHGETANDDPDGAFNPIVGAPQRRTDYEIGRVTLPAGASFTAPGGETGQDSVGGFYNPVPLPRGVAIFLSDGSVSATGAFRVADARGNYLETIAAPRTSVRVEIRKWDGEAWRSRGEGGSAWQWN
jgi:hypothetical protein